MNGNYIAIYFFALRQFEGLNEKEKRFNMFNYLLSKYSFLGEIRHKNIFHILSECWILTLSKQFKTRLLENGELNYSQFTFNQILNFFLSTEVDCEIFYSMLKKIISMSKTSFDLNYSFSELKLSYIFIDKIEKEKNEEFKNCLYDVELITKDQFEHSLMSILRKGVNLTINEINTYEKNKESLFLYNNYLFLRKKKYNSGLILNASLNISSSNNLIDLPIKRKTSYDIEIKVPDVESYKQQILQNDNIKQRKDIGFVLLLSELYYFFADTNYCNFLQDIKYLIFSNSDWKNKLLMLMRELHKNKNNTFLRFIYAKTKHLLFIYKQTQVLYSKYNCFLYSIYEYCVNSLSSFYYRQILFFKRLININVKFLNRVTKVLITRLNIFI